MQSCFAQISFSFLGALDLNWNYEAFFYWVSKSHATRSFSQNTIHSRFLSLVSCDQKQISNKSDLKTQSLTIKIVSLKLPFTADFLETKGKNRMSQRQSSAVYARLYWMIACDEKLTKKLVKLFLLVSVLSMKFTVKLHFQASQTIKKQTFREENGWLGRGSETLPLRRRFSSKKISMTNLITIES